MPDRSRVWSASSLPGTAGSGICFTQTAMFMRGRLRQASGRADRRRAAEHGLILACERADHVPNRRRYQSGLYRRTVTSAAARRGARRGRRTGRDRRRRSTARRLGLDVLVVDKARFPRDKTCGDGLTTGALRGLEALGLDVRDAAVVRAGHRDRARLADRARGRAPAPGRRRVRRCGARAPSSTPRSSTAPRDARRRRCATASASPTCVADDRRRHRRPRRRHDRCAAQWVVAADGHYSPVRRMLDADGAGELTRSLSSAPGTRSASTSAASTTAGCGCCSTPTSCPGTRGCSPSAAAAPTSASACCATATQRCARRARQLAAQWRERSSTARASRAHPRPRRRGRRHAPRLADPRVVRRARASRTAGCCSPATPPTSSTR